MMSRISSRLPSYLVYALTILSAALLSTLFYVSVEAGSVEEMEQNFKARKQWIEEEVGSRRLPGESGEKASELWLSLQRSLIDNNAKMEKLKLEIMEYSGDRREKALEELIRTSEDRVLIILDHKERLERIAPVGHTAVKRPGEPESPTRKMEEHENGSSEIRLRFKPEDLIHGEQSME